MKNSLYLKVIFAAVLALLVSNILMREIFLANSPRLRPNLGSYLASKIAGVLSLPGRWLASLRNTFFASRDTPEVVLRDVPFKIVAKGVYAKRKANYSYVLIKANEVEWVEYRFDIKGRQITVKVPKGSIPPVKEEIEKLY